MFTTDGAVDVREVGLAPTWSTHLKAAERALGRQDGAGALRAWEHAHLAAVESLSWEGLIAAGHAYLRIGRTVSPLQGAEATARRAYFAALYRACRDNSFDGVLRAADAFAELGDRDVVDECLGLAELLADGEEPRRRLTTMLDRFGTRSGERGAGVDRAARRDAAGN
jgi:hypothetical protein